MMSLFNIEVWPRGYPADAPEWQCELDAENIDQAYVIGGQQFHMERPELDPEDYVMKATHYHP